MPSILKKEDNIDINELLEAGYDISVVNQIIKVAEKGVDISDITMNVDIDTLRPLTRELFNGSIYKKMFDFYKSLRETRGIKINKEYEDLIKKIDDLIKNGFDENILLYLNLYDKGNNLKRLVSLENQANKIEESILPFLQKGFNTGEIEQILFAHEKNFKIENYIKTETEKFDRDRLQALNLLHKHYLKNNIELDNTFSKLAECRMTLRVMKKAIEALEGEKDLSPIFDRGYENSQLGILISAIRDGLDYSYLENKKLTVQQMNEIYTGLRQNIDVSLFSNENFTDIQMKTIRILLVKNSLSKPEEIIDPTPLLNPKISSFEMELYIEAKEKKDLEVELKLLDDFKKYETPIKKENEKNIER